MNRLSPLPAGYRDLDDAEPSFDERQAPPIGETGKDEKCVVYHPTLFVWRDPTLIPRRQFIYGKSLIRGFLSVLVAPGGVGKSSLSIAEATAMASGRDLLDVRPREPLRVWYLNLEDPREEIERRVAPARLHYGLGPDDLSDRLSFDGRETEVILAEQTRAGTRIAVPIERALTDALVAGNYDVLIVDPFISTHLSPRTTTGRSTPSPRPLRASRAPPIAPSCLSITSERRAERRLRPKTAAGPAPSAPPPASCASSTA